MKRNKIIKLFEPFVGEDEIKVTSSVLKGKFWASGAGTRKVSQFENALTKYVGCKKSVAVNSGTAALHLSLSILGIQKKEVLVPTITFSSTAHAAIYNNAKPKFVDVDESTLCIDTEDLEKKITKNSAVVIPVHFGGIPCNLKQIHKLARDYKIHVVEDAAHACGSSYNGKKIGSHSELVCFSFHPVKNLSMPMGGAISLNSSLHKIESLNSLRWCGISKRKEASYDIDSAGWNYYMNEISASIGLVQIKRIEKLNSIRRKIAKKYAKYINVENKMHYLANCCYHLYWIRVKNRDEFMKKMKKAGIETGIHYKPLHLMSFYKNSTRLQKSEKIWKEIVSLPMHPNLTNNDVEKIIKNVNRLSK